MEYWYTAVRNGKSIRAISGPYGTKEEADSYVEAPNSRDRRICEALDCKAVFYHYMTIKVSDKVETVLQAVPEAKMVVQRIAEESQNKK
jgi:hypothetical protein